MLRHVHLSCATKGCFGVVTVHPDEEDRLRRTGETFYCPAGHSMWFKQGKSKDQERIEDLERDLEWTQKARDRAWEQLTGVHDAAVLVTRGAQTCPLGCGWQCSSLGGGYTPTPRTVSEALGAALVVLFDPTLPCETCGGRGWVKNPRSAFNSEILSASCRGSGVEPLALTTSELQATPNPAKDLERDRQVGSRSDRDPEARR